MQTQIQIQIQIQINNLQKNRESKLKALIREWDDYFDKNKEMRNSGYICQKIENILDKLVYDIEKANEFRRILINLKHIKNFFADRKKDINEIQKLINLDIGGTNPNNYSFIP